VTDFSERLADFVLEELHKHQNELTEANSARNGPQDHPNGEIEDKAEPHGGIISSRLINRTSIA